MANASITREANEALAARVGQSLTRAGLRLISVESCTGGMIAAVATSVPGSSDWFEGAFVTYRLSAKTRFVGVPTQTLEIHGAVSEPTVRAMAEGALIHSDADLSVAVTGIAGPEGGDVVAPVGTVWFGWAQRVSNGEISCLQTAEHHLTGDRQAVREQATGIALEGVLTATAADDRQ